MREAHSGAAGRFRWRRHDRFGVVVGEGVVEPRIEGLFARRVGAGVHAHPLLPEPEMAQDALDEPNLAASGPARAAAAPCDQKPEQRRQLRR